MDPVLDVDWAAHWRHLVESRAAQKGDRQEDYWERRAPSYGAWRRDQHDLFLDFLAHWLRPTRTLIDVGAGTGRHAAELARALDWVTAVEPSPGMRDQIPPTENMTVIASTWEDADPAPADLVICVHVLYAVAEPVPFIEKLERHARERVFLVLRDSQHAHPAERMVAASRVREPRMRDCFLLLRQLDVAPELSFLRYPSSFSFRSLEAAVEDCRLHLGAHWDEAAGRAWLEAHLEPRQDGTLLYDAGEVTAGILHWTPRT